MEGQVGLGVLGTVLLVAGCALAVVGRKQKAGALRRNWFAGLRTWETMESDAAWHAAHRATAGLVTTAGAALTTAGIVLLVLQPAQEATVAAIVLGGTGATLGLVLAAGVRGHRIAKQVNRDHAEDPT